MKNAVVTSLIGTNINTKKAETVEGLSWLYNSWLHNNNEGKWDLIVLLDPLSSHMRPILEPLFKYATFIDVMPNNGWASYTESNKTAGFDLQETKDKLLEYNIILKTSYNSILLPSLFKVSNLEKTIVGSGGWQLFTDSDFNGMIKHKLKEVSKEIGLNYWGFYGADDSILGPSETVVNILATQTALTKILISRYDEFKETPAFSSQLLHSYAFDLAINAFTNNFRLHVGGLDLKPNMRCVSYFDIQIKPWRMAESGFNIDEWFKGEIPKAEKGLHKHFDSLAEYAIAVASMQKDS